MTSVLQWTDHAGPAELTADVVVVGTGAGGAVVAAELAEAGLRVVMVEEGGWVRTEDFDPDMVGALKRLYRDLASTLILGPPHIAFAEGRCVGGSTTINGGMSFRTPDEVLAHWSGPLGMPSLAPDGMDRWFSRVERRLSVARQLPLSLGKDSLAMRRGADALGFDWIENTRAQALCVGTNNCAFGCPTGAKQSTLVSYVPRALAAGATLLCDCRVTRVRIEGGRAAGVEGAIVDPRTRAVGHRVVVRAPRVVLSCGAVQTPVLMLRQRLANRSRMVGRNFLCHPNAKVIGVYPNDIEGWKGVAQGQQVRGFRDEGIIMAENMVPPGMLATGMPDVGGALYAAMQRYNQMVATAVLVEDSTSGRVRSGMFGMPYIRYAITPSDFRRFRKGIVHLAKLHFAAGAERVLVPFPTCHELRSVAEAEALATASLRSADIELFTVHLMGTCRMGTDPQRAVVDEWGRSHDVAGLYVADASVFPTAVGVNPQVTIMALATRTAEHIADRPRPAAPHV